MRALAFIAAAGAIVAATLTACPTPTPPNPPPQPDADAAPAIEAAPPSPSACATACAALARAGCPEGLAPNCVDRFTLVEHDRTERNPATGSALSCADLIGDAGETTPEIARKNGVRCADAGGTP